MKRILLVFILISSLALGQKTSGTAMYRIQITDVKDDIQPLIKGLEPVLNELTYKLSFDNTKSKYQIEKILDIGDSRRIEAAKIISGKGTYYYEKNKQLLIQREFAGDLFLISADFDTIDWNIIDERKKIGEFNCLKAIGFKKTSNNDLKQIIAWFTTDVNAPYGPKDYLGLPGLILEVEDNGLKYICESISFGNEKFKKPTEGIKISQKELNEYVTKRAYEEFKIKQ